MKRTELAKEKLLKINARLTHAQGANPVAQKGQSPGAQLDRREQRKKDQALGLVPFAVKLDQELVKTLSARALATGAPMAEIVDKLLRAGLAASQE